MRLAIFTALLAGTAFAQSGESAYLDSADVHPVAGRSIAAMRSRYVHDIYELRNASLLDMVSTAWRVDADNVLGGPDWLAINRYDIVANFPQGTKVIALLRDLLAERFHLVAHTEIQQQPAWFLTVAKKNQLIAAEQDAPSTCRSITNASPKLICTNITMAALAGHLRRSLFNYTVVDKTGLEGGWNFTIPWSTNHIESVEKLGFKLTRGEVEVPVVVVESASPSPTLNRPGIAQNILATSEFEVINLKLDDPDKPASGSHVRISPGGGIEMLMDLRGFIGEAWIDLNPDLIENLPRSADSTRFALYAKAPVDAYADSPAVWNGTDIDSMRFMLRRVLQDRFGLKFQMEDRQADGLKLVAGKLKLRQAEPGNRASCKEGPGADGRDPRLADPVRSRLVTCRNMTMALFAAELREFGGAYLHQFPPIVDSTGIEGRYDMTVSFSPPAALKPRPGEEFADPNGAISLQEALEQQLGLKLQSTKVKTPVMVIDHVSEMPAEN